MKKIISCIAMLVLFTSCGTNTPPVNNSSGVDDSDNTIKKIQISASLVPLASVINNIGGEYVDVNTIIPPGVSPHGFDLSPRQMQTIADSEAIFIVGGLGIDDFLEKIDVAAKIFPLSEGLTLLSAEAHDHDKHSEDEHSSGVEGIDPHVWLGKENILLIANQLKTELSVLLPEQAEYFNTNTLNFENDLEKIFADFEEKNKDIEAKEFIVFHDAYNYLFDSVGIDNDKKIVFSPNSIGEIGTAHMSELIDEIKIHGVKDIFSEPQFSSESVTDFAEKYSLTLSMLDPLGTDDSQNGYFTNLKINLEQLQSIYE